MESRLERLFDKSEAILEGRRNGLGEPILRHLAMRSFGPAMLCLANRNTQTGCRSEFGSVRDAFSPAGLTYRAYKRGELYAAQNMAMSLFNIGDLAGYRHWMRRAARAGGIEAEAELKLFEIRQPHNLARRLSRLRPYRRDGR